MDIEVKQSPEAIEDIDSIAEYIARDSEFYARSVVNEILSLGTKIAEEPLIGRIVPELDDENIRERFVYSYRVVYTIEDTVITVVAVIHGKRLLENVPDRFQKNT